MAGIVSYGGYVPRYRLDRNLIYKSMGWMNPGTIANARGEKAVANFDEDSITMAVAASIDALKSDRSKVEGVYSDDPKKNPDAKLFKKLTDHPFIIVIPPRTVQ